jgi:hypothetical protein
MGMLIESVMAANAAYAIIKQTISNGKEIHDCAKSIGVYLSHKEKIEAEVKSGKGKNDLDAFMELEKLKKQETELKFMMNKSRLGMWSDYQTFISKRAVMRKKLKQTTIKSSKAKQKNDDQEIKVALSVLTFLLLSIVGFGSAYLLGYV